MAAATEHAPRLALGRRASQRIAFAYFAASLICLLAAGWLIAPRYLGLHRPLLPDARRTITATTDRPVEANISKTQAAAYSVPADQPRSIAIPAIRASGLIQRVGLTADHALAAPTNIYFAGWYTGSAKPGDRGLSIIDGHVSGWYHDGIFRHLDALEPDDSITVEYGDGSTRRFKVASVQQVSADQASAMLFKRQDNVAAQLNLITCGGTFNWATKAYNDRVIVIASENV